jgi:hypothetical protein
MPDPSRHQFIVTIMMRTLVATIDIRHKASFRVSQKRIPSHRVLSPESCFQFSIESMTMSMSIWAVNFDRSFRCHTHLELLIRTILEDHSDMQFTLKYRNL